MGIKCNDTISQRYKDEIDELEKKMEKDFEEMENMLNMLQDNNRTLLALICDILTQQFKDLQVEIRIVPDKVETSIIRSDERK